MYKNKDNEVLKNEGKIKYSNIKFDRIFRTTTELQKKQSIGFHIVEKMFENMRENKKKNNKNNKNIIIKKLIKDLENKENSQIQIPRYDAICNERNERNKHTRDSTVFRHKTSLSILKFYIKNIPAEIILFPVYYELSKSILTNDNKDKILDYTDFIKYSKKIVEFDQEKSESRQDVKNYNRKSDTRNSSRNRDNPKNRDSSRIRGLKNRPKLGANATRVLEERLVGGQSFSRSHGKRPPRSGGPRPGSGQQYGRQNSSGQKRQGDKSKDKKDREADITKIKGTIRYKLIDELEKNIKNEQNPLFSSKRKLLKDSMYKYFFENTNSKNSKISDILYEKCSKESSNGQNYNKEVYKRYQNCVNIAFCPFIGTGQPDSIYKVYNDYIKGVGRIALVKKHRERVQDLGLENFFSDYYKKDKKGQNTQEIKHEKYNSETFKAVAETYYDELDLDMILVFLVYINEHASKINNVDNNNNNGDYNTKIQEIDEDSESNEDNESYEDNENAEFYEKNENNENKNNRKNENNEYKKNENKNNRNNKKNEIEIFKNKKVLREKLTDDLIKLKEEICKFYIYISIVKIQLLTDEEKELSDFMTEISNENDKQMQTENRKNNDKRVNKTDKQNNKQVDRSNNKNKKIRVNGNTKTKLKDLENDIYKVYDSELSTYEFGSIKYNKLEKNRNNLIDEIKNTRNIENAIKIFKKHFENNKANNKANNK